MLVTCGPYLPVHLESYNARIENVQLLTAIAADSADLTANINFGSAPPQGATVKIQIYDDQGTEVAAETVGVGTSSAMATVNVTVSRPKLWWPNGHGKQILYGAVTTLREFQGRTLDARVDRFGFRTIRLIQRKLDDAPGETFMFNVNGIDIFSQGCNWIPGDNFIPRITRGRYYAWMKLAKHCNLNMIRVWGGGLYETEDFYDACDEMGLLVWQDYAFACGDYPLHDKFLESVRKEAEYHTCRLRNRACLALLCGGNEDFMTIDLFFKE